MTQFDLRETVCPPPLACVYNKTMGKATKPSAVKAKNKELKLRGIPRRPLSSYNIFFSIQRKKILDDQQPMTQDKNGNRAHVGFANLAHIIAQQWKNVDPTLKAELEVKAHQDRIRYKHEMRDWEVKQKMEAIKADLERITTEVNARESKMQDMKKELEQMKQVSNETKVHEQKETVPDAKPTRDEDIGFECFESAAADLDEAIAFLKDTRASPISQRDSIAGTSYTPVYTTNVFGSSAITAFDVPPSLIRIKIEVMKKELEQMNQMSNETKVHEKKDTVPDAKSKTDEDIGFECFESAAADLDEAIAFLKDTHASPLSRCHSIAGTSYTPMHRRNVFGSSAMAASYFPTSLSCMGNVAVTPSSVPWIPMVPSCSRLPFATASRTARSNGMSVSSSRGLKYGNTGAASHCSELQRYVGINPLSQETAATLQSRRHSSMY